MGWLFCSSASGQGSLEISEDGEPKSTEAREFRSLKVQHVFAGFCALPC